MFSFSILSLFLISFFIVSLSTPDSSIMSCAVFHLYLGWWFFIISSLCVLSLNLYWCFWTVFETTSSFTSEYQILLYVHPCFEIYPKCLYTGSPKPVEHNSRAPRMNYHWIPSILSSSVASLFSSRLLRLTRMELRDKSLRREGHKGIA